MSELAHDGTEHATSPGASEQTLYQDITGGQAIDAENLTISNEDTGEQVRVRRRGPRTAVTRDGQTTVFADHRLQMTPYGADEEGSSVTQTASSSLPGDREAVIVLRPVPSAGLARILDRDRDVRRRALEWRNEHGDPLDRMIELLDDIIGDSPEDREAWDALVDEPD